MNLTEKSLLDNFQYITVDGVEKKLAGGITDYEVIDLETTLPTATSTSPDFVQISGELYFKQASVWDYPEQTGNELKINQIYSATQTGTELEII